MACFWEGILSSLSTVDKVKLGINNHIPNLIEALKKYNTRDITVLWQNKDISKKEKDENYTHINDYSVNSYNKGYLCSTCDPFLILVSHILHVDIRVIPIRHMFLKATQDILHIKKNTNF